MFNKTAFLFFLMISLIRSAQAAGPSAGLMLYQKLRTEFNSSRTPFPIDNIAMQSLSVKSQFSVCESVLADGRINRTEGFLSFKMLLSDGNGPFGNTRTILDFGHPTWVSSYLGGGALFENGALDMRNVRWERATVEFCKDETSPNDLLLNYRFGLTPDKMSFQIQSACNDGSHMTGLDARITPTGILVAHFLNSNPAIDAYLYCWK